MIFLYLLHSNGLFYKLVPEIINSVVFFCDIMGVMLCLWHYVCNIICLRLCLWRYVCDVMSVALYVGRCLWHYVYDVMSMILCLWSYGCDFCLWTLCLWRYICDVMSVLLCLWRLGNADYAIVEAEADKVAKQAAEHLRRAKKRIKSSHPSNQTTSTKPRFCSSMCACGTFIIHINLSGFCILSSVWYVTAAYTYIS